MPRRHSCAGFTLKRLLIVVACLAIAFAIIGSIGRALSVARQSSLETACRGQIYYLQHAMVLYESHNGNFPPAFIAGPDGTPWHSWRVLLMPYLDSDMKELYKSYSFDEPWNGPNNRKLMDKIDASVYQCRCGPDYEKTQMTNFVVVVGKDTLFPGESTLSIDDLSGTNVMSIVEIDNSNIHWMEPRDLKFNEIKSPTARSPKIGSPHPSGACVVNNDCSDSGYVSKDASPAEIADLFRIKK